MRLAWGTFCLFLCLCGPLLFSQELSETVFASEDELWEALRDGDITYEQYLVLREIAEHGLDSTNRHLLDEIPNLSHLLDSDSTLADPLEGDQVSGFRAVGRAGSRVGGVDGRVGYRYQTLMDEEQQSWFRHYADVSFLDRWRISWQVNRERSGIERVVSRSVRYRGRDGLVRRIEAGSFTTRFGLGSVFGHRGRMFDFSSEIDGESLLMPDYGGFNGVLVEFRPGAWVVQTVNSVIRDSAHCLTANGLMVQRATGHFKPGLIVGDVSLRSRSSGVSTAIPTRAAFVQYDYSAGYSSAELGYQGGSSVTVLVEGKHRLETAELRYAVWRYEDDFVDLTAGSKSAVLYVEDTVESVQFAYRSRRVGQSGGLARTAVQLGREVTFANSLLYARNNRGARREQLSSSLYYSMSADWQWRLAYSGDWRLDPARDPKDRYDHKFRLEARYAAARTRARCYIGYAVDNRGNEHASLFLSLKRSLSDGSAYEVWTNFGEIDGNGLNYWYAFVRGQWPLGDVLTAATKISNSYRRDSDERNTTQLSLELTAEL